METDPRALRQQSDTPEAPASNSSAGSTAPESRDVAGRPHHSHPHRPNGPGRAPYSSCTSAMQPVYRARGRTSGPRGQPTPTAAVVRLRGDQHSVPAHHLAARREARRANGERRWRRSPRQARGRAEPTAPRPSLRRACSAGPGRRGQPLRKDRRAPANRADWAEFLAMIPVGPGRAFHRVEPAALSVVGPLRPRACAAHA